MWSTLLNDVCTATLTLTAQVILRRLEVPIMRRFGISDEMFELFVKPAYEIIDRVVHEASISKYIIFRRVSKQDWDIVEQQLRALVDEQPSVVPRQIRDFFRNPPQFSRERKRQLRDICRRIAVMYLKVQEKREITFWRMMGGTKWQALTNMAYERYSDLEQEDWERRKKLIISQRNDMVVWGVQFGLLFVEAVLIVLTAMHKL